MFYIKNDDIEDMFKKAADEYKLNEEMAADWNSVLSALQDDEKFVPLVKKEKKRRLYLLWFLLLIPAIAIFTYKTGLFSTNKNVHYTSVIATQKNNNNGQKLSEKKDLVTKGTTNNSIKKIKSNTNFQKVNSSNKKLSANNKFPVHKQLPRVNNATDKDDKNFLQDDADHSINNTSLPGNSNNSSINNNSSQTNIANNNKEQDKLPQTNSFNTTSNNNQLKSVNDTAKNEIVQSNTSKHKKKNNNNYTRQAYVYTGFIGNADLSFVKFQKASSLGFGLGVIGGYHFKNGLSLETGILYDKKNYYTRGEYFNKGDLVYLQYVNLLAANGNCNMWEIPITVKYDFNTQKKFNWFVTAGISSYIMNKEYYNFKYEKDGVLNEKGYNYYHSSKNWFSVLNVGGGINIKTSNKYFLQVQPYYKIPLSGVGTGSLSLSSAGINFSITRRLH